MCEDGSGGEVEAVDVVGGVGLILEGVLVKEERKKGFYSGSADGVAGLTKRLGFALDLRNEIKSLSPKRKIEKQKKKISDLQRI